MLLEHFFFAFNVSKVKGQNIVTLLTITFIQHSLRPFHIGFCQNTPDHYYKNIFSYITLSDMIRLRDLLSFLKRMKEKKYPPYFLFQFNLQHTGLLSVSYSRLKGEKKGNKYRNWQAGVFFCWHLMIIIGKENDWSD